MFYSNKEICNLKVYSFMLRFGVNRLYLKVLKVYKPFLYLNIILPLWHSFLLFVHQVLNTHILNLFFVLYNILLEFTTCPHKFELLFDTEKQVLITGTRDL